MKNFSFSASRFPGLVACLCTPDSIYFSGRSHIWRLGLGDNEENPLAPLPLPRWLRQVSRFRLLRRLGRLDLRELRRTASGHLLGISQKSIVRLDRGAGEFRNVFQILNGGRPKAIAASPGGQLFVGEYWGNPRMQPLRIWMSGDEGNNWDLAHTLPAGSAKHIHNIVWDPYRQGFWVLTGDLDGECALLFTGDEFETLTEVVRGGQQFRACHLFCRPEGLYYATDTERDLNWVVFLEPESGSLEKIQPMPGSCINAARMAGRYWLSTSVEPSKVNRGRHTILWSSNDLLLWNKVTEFAKDWWPGEQFGFGSIVLPRVQGNCEVLVFSPVAVKSHDLETLIVYPEDLNRCRDEGSAHEPG